MRLTITRKRAAVLILGGILLPGLLSYAGFRWFEDSHGVATVYDGKVSLQPELGRALDDLDDKSQVKFAQISGYVWVREPGVYFILKSLGGRRFFIDGKELIELRRAPYGIQKTPTPSGFHRFDLNCHPQKFDDDRTFQWTPDFVDAHVIPAERLYRRPMTRVELALDLAGQWAGILARVNFILLVLILGFAAVRRILRKVALLPEIEPGQRASGFFLIVFVVMLCVRFSGIQYQLPEGLHPDERMVENSVLSFRSGDLRPRQYFWSAGYEYLTAALETAGEWAWAGEFPRHLVARLLSITFSWLSCWVLFSIARKLFNKPAAYWSAAFLGFTLMPIEVGHEGIVESTMVFSFLVAFRILLELDAEKKREAFFVAGMAAGLAAGIKQTAGIVVLPTALHFLSISSGRRLEVFQKSIFWGIGAVAGFLCLSPFTLLDFSNYWATQVWQLRSQQGLVGSSLFFVEDTYRFGGLIRNINFLTDGMGYPLLAAAVAGILIVAWKARKAALLTVPVALVYFAVCSYSAASPYHYALLLCPFVALFAAVAMQATLAKVPHRNILGPLLGISLLLPSLFQDYRLLTVLQGNDSRREAEVWCNRNLPPGSRIDYEMFGPRFLLPLWPTSRLPLLHRQSWDDYLADRRTKYYMFDDITADVFDGFPDTFPIETEWFQKVKETRIVHEFSGAAYRIYNPHLTLYEVNVPAR